MAAETLHLLSIVIPARNEQESLPETVASIEAASLPPHEVVVVDDHSTDATWAVALGLERTHPSVRAVRNEGPAGFADAILAGFARSQGDAVVPMMADLCDDPATVALLWDRVSAGADVACGSRYVTGGRKVGGPWLKSILSRTFGHLVHWLTGLPTWDATNSYKMYRRGRRPRTYRFGGGYAVSLEWVLNAWFAGARVVEVPTTWRDRTRGCSHFRMGRAVEDYGRLLLHTVSRVLTGRALP